MSTNQTIGGLIRSTLHEAYGIAEKTPLRKNAIAATICYLPCIPNYMIPAYSQTVETGSAKGVKKREGLRGILTGALDGAAIGAITARGMKLTFKRVAVFAAVMACADYISSKFLPILGEKLGKMVYNMKQKKNKLAQTGANNVTQPAFASAPTSLNTTFSQFQPSINKA